MKPRPNDFSFLEGAIPELEDYLLSDQLFWPLGSGERLSMGALLLAVKRIGAVAETHEEREKFKEAHEKIEAIRSRWRTNWSNKAQKEFSARLRQWSHVLSEFFSEQKSQTVVYPHEVTWRVILHELEDEIIKIPEEDILELEALDERLKAGSKKGKFVWDQELKCSFPEQQYWFLYLELTKGES